MVLHRKLLLAIVLGLATFLISGCSNRGNEILDTQIIDSLNIYSKTFKENLKKAHSNFPPGIRVLIFTVDSIPTARIGVFADSILDHKVKLEEERKNSILVVVSKSPQLLQIRYGEDLKLEAYKAGLIMGNTYLDYQKNFITKGSEDGLIYVLNDLSIQLPKALDLSWIMKIQKPVVKRAFEGLSDVATPSEDFYTKALFRPYSRFLSSIKLLSSPLILIAFNALILMLLISIGDKLIEKVFKPGRIKFVIVIVWKLIASLAFAIPFWASLIFLNSLRTEDRLFANYLGIPMLASDSFSKGYSSYTPFWFALIIGVLVLVVEFSLIYMSGVAIQLFIDPTNNKNLDDSSSEEVFNSTISRATAVAFLALFMPFLISLLILFYYILKIPKSISTYIKLNKLNI